MPMTNNTLRNPIIMEQTCRISNGHKCNGEAEQISNSQNEAPDLLVMKQFSLLEINSTAVLLAMLL